MRTPLLRLGIAASLFFSFPIFAQSQAASSSPILTLFALCFALLTIILLWYRLYQQQQQLQHDREGLQRVLAESSSLIAVLNEQFVIQHASQSLSSLLHPATSPSTSLPFAVFADSAAQVNLVPTIKRHLKQQHEWQGEGWLYQYQATTPFLISIQKISESHQQDRFLLFGQSVAEYRYQTQQLLNACFHDQNTQLCSKRLFEEYLGFLLQSCNATHSSIAVALIKLRPSLNLASNASCHTPILQFGQQLLHHLPTGVLLANLEQQTLGLLIPPHLCTEDNTAFFNQLADNVQSCYAECTTELRDHHKIAFVIGSCAAAKNTAVSIMTQLYWLAEQVSMQAEQPLFHIAEYDWATLSKNDLARNNLSPQLRIEDVNLLYLPRFSISSNRVVGFEAILYWPGQEPNAALPQYNLPLQQHSGLISKLERICFRKICQQIAFWEQTGLMRGRVSLKISDKHILQGSFLRFAEATLSEFEVNAHSICLELSESLFKYDNITEKLNQLSQFGFKLIFDQFGAGTSSITQLQSLPLHGVKFASSMVADIEHNELQRNICASLIRLLGYMQKEVIAPHIETEMQAYLLHVMGCDTQQGNRFSQAISPEQVGPLLLQERQILGQQRQNTAG